MAPALIISFKLSDLAIPVMALHTICTARFSHEDIAHPTRRSHNLKTVGSRLEQLEHSVSKIQSSLELVMSQASANPLLSGSSSRVNLPSLTQKPDSWSPFQKPAKLNQSPGRRHIVCDADGCERYFGSTSLASMVHEISEFVLRPLSMDDSEDAISQSATVVCEQINLLSIEEEHFELPQDGSTPSSPPLAMLDALIDPYFAAINCYLPIWSKEQIRRLVDSDYSGKVHTEDRAHIICFNNMMLLTLTAKSLQARARSATHSTSHQAGLSMDFEIIKPFLANAKRALQSLELLLSPRLINVQALLSLCLIAQQHFTPSMFRTLFSLAVQVAKSIGLHHPDAGRYPRNPEAAQERKNVFYSLYVLDKAVSWTAGWSACLPTSDADLPTASQDPYDNVSGHLIAKVKMAQIQEEAYVTIYSSQARRKNEAESSQHVSSLSMTLEKWWAEYGTVLEDETPNEHFPPCSKADLRFTFHSTRMMVDWPIYKQPDTCGRFLDDARTCMKLLLRLWNATSDLGSYATLPRLIASHPAISLFTLAAHMLSIEMVESDLQLLHSFVGMLQRITETNETKTHNTQLYEVSRNLSELTTASTFQPLLRRSTLLGGLLRTSAGIEMPSNQDVHAVFGQLPPATQSINDYTTLDGAESPMLFPSMDLEPGFLHEYSLNELATSPRMDGNRAAATPNFSALDGLMEAKGPNLHPRVRSRS